jgi:hypothetical protein
VDSVAVGSFASAWRQPWSAHGFACRAKPWPRLVPTNFILSLVRYQHAAAAEALERHRCCRLGNSVAASQPIEYAIYLRSLQCQGPQYILELGPAEKILYNPLSRLDFLKNVKVGKIHIMKLYRVDVYSEYYYKAYRKPFGYDSDELLGDPSDYGIYMDLMGLVAAFGGAFYVLWNVRKIPMAEVRIPGYPGKVTPEVWEQAWVTVYNTWLSGVRMTTKMAADIQFLFDHRPKGAEMNMEWLRMASEAHRYTWSFMTSSQRQYWVGLRYWEEIHATNAWKSIYNQALTRWQTKFGSGPESSRMAARIADNMVQRLGRNEVSVNDLERWLQGGSLTSIFDRVLAWVTGLGSTFLLRIGFIGIAVFCIGLLIVNPEEWGVRRKFYYGSIFLIAYKERCWWADLVGRSKNGKSVFHMCDRVRTVILDTYVVGKRVTGASEYIYLLVDGHGLEYFGWYYWVTWPKQITGTFLGYLRKITGSEYVLQDGYGKVQPAPVELYRDRFGNLISRTPSWWPQPGSVGLKPDYQICRWQLPQWVYQPQEPLFI